MIRFAPLLLLALPCLLTSCGLANSLIQGPYRLLQSAGRTITDAADPATDPIQIALSK
jgi:predicted small secreted protein